MYMWSGWDEDDSTDEIPDKYIITIWTPGEEEMAVIVHRTCDGKYPLDGDVANEKLLNAQQIVDALNYFSK